MRSVIAITLLVIIASAQCQQMRPQLSDCLYGLALCISDASWAKKTTVGQMKDKMKADIDKATEDCLSAIDGLQSPAPLASAGNLGVNLTPSCLLTISVAVEAFKTKDLMKIFKSVIEIKERCF